MAYSISHAFLGFLFILLISQSVNVLAGRDIKPAAEDKKLEPEWLGHNYDGTVLVPGLGRFMVPKKGSHVNPFTYNPVTGTNGGAGVVTGGLPGGATTGHSYVPGGDDTFLPNPGFQMPNPAGGSIPAPSQP